MKYVLIAIACIIGIILYKIDKYQTDRESKLVKVKVIKKEKLGSGDDVFCRLSILYDESVYTVAISESTYIFLDSPKIKDMCIYGNLISIYKRGKLTKKFISEIFISEEKLYDWY